MTSAHVVKDVNGPEVEVDECGTANCKEGLTFFQKIAAIVKSGREAGFAWRPARSAPRSQDAQEFQDEIEAWDRASDEAWQQIDNSPERSE